MLPRHYNIHFGVTEFLLLRANINTRRYNRFLCSAAPASAMLALKVHNSDSLHVGRLMVHLYKANILVSVASATSLGDLVYVFYVAFFISALFWTKLTITKVPRDSNTRTDAIFRNCIVLRHPTHPIFRRPIFWINVSR